MLPSPRTLYVFDWPVVLPSSYDRPIRRNHPLRLCFHAPVSAPIFSPVAAPFHCVVQHALCYCPLPFPQIAAASAYLPFHFPSTVIHLIVRTATAPYNQAATG